MNAKARQDLVSLTDDDLVRAGNRGLFQRSQKELDSGRYSAEVAADGGLVRVSWSDGPVCEFPARSSIRGGRCTCGAGEVCRHLVRSVLYLRSRAREEGVAVAPQAPPEDLIELPRTLFEKRFGKRAVQRAERELHEGLGAERGDPERREVHFPRLGVRIAFPRGADADATLCDCGEPAPCPHFLPALLVLRGDVAPPPAKEAREEGESAVARLRRLVAELFRVGLDGLSPGWLESAAATALLLDKAGEETLAALLERLTSAIDADARRSGRADPAVVRATLAALWLRRERPAACEPYQPTRSFSVTTQRTLSGLGMGGWWGDETLGVTVYLLDEEAGEIVTASTGRPNDGRWEVESVAASASVLGVFTAAQLVNRRFRCPALRLTADRRVRLVPEAPLEPLADAVDWPAIIERHAVRDLASVADRLADSFPTALTLYRPEVFLFEASEWGEATFLVDVQELRWPMRDHRGAAAPLVVGYRKERAAAIENLRRLAASVRPTFVLGRVRFGGRGMRIEPIVLGWRRRGEVRTHQVDFPVAAEATS